MVKNTFNMACKNKMANKISSYVFMSMKECEALSSASSPGGASMKPFGELHGAHYTTR